MFASTIEETLLKQDKAISLATEKASQFLQEKLFFPGNRMPWPDLIQYVTGKPLSQGGIDGRTEATGQGLYYGVRAAMNHVEDMKAAGLAPGLRGNRIIVQGLENGEY